MATRINSSSAIENAIIRIQRCNINFLAIDFDQTFIDIHTGGHWPGTSEELLLHVRPEFRDLVLSAIAHDIRVAIVTFSRQASLIRRVLEASVGVEVASKIPIRGGDRSWSYEGVGSQDGKQAHMASAVEELEQNGEIDISKATTLLIDDDKRNVQIALQDGVRAIWFRPHKPHHLLQDLAKLEPKEQPY